MIVEPARELCKKAESQINTEIFCKELRSHLAARFNLALVFYLIFASVWR